MKRLLLCVPLLFAACAPRDVDVASDADRARYSRKPETTATSENGFRLGNYSLAAHLIDRAAEAAQILRWSLQPETRSLKSETPAERRTLWSMENQLDAAGFDIEEEKIVDLREALVAPADGPFERWQVKVTQANRWRSRADESLRLETSQRRHLIRISEVPEGYRVDVDVDGGLVLAKNGKSEIHPWVQSVSFLAVKTDDGFELRELRGQMNVASLQRDYAIQADRLAVVFEDCVRVTGDATITSGRRPATLSFQPDRLAVTDGGSWAMDLPACAKRPVIDLFRLIAP